MSSSSVLASWVSTTLTAMGARIFRNFVGGAWAGKGVKVEGGGVFIAHPTHIDAGLCVGSSDHIGWTSVTVTPDMTGERVAIFTAVEEKTLAYSKLTPEQVNFLDRVTEAGGIGYVARETKNGPLLTKWPE